MLKQTLEKEGAIKFCDMYVVFPYVLQFLQHVFFLGRWGPNWNTSATLPLGVPPNEFGGKNLLEIDANASRLISLLSNELDLGSWGMFGNHVSKLQKAI